MCNLFFSVSWFHDHLLELLVMTSDDTHLCSATLLTSGLYVCVLFYSHLTRQLTLCVCIQHYRHLSVDWSRQRSTSRTRYHGDRFECDWTTSRGSNQNPSHWLVDVSHMQIDWFVFFWISLMGKNEKKWKKWILSQLYCIIYWIQHGLNFQHGGRPSGYSISAFIDETPLKFVYFT